MTEEPGGLQSMGLQSRTPLSVDGHTHTHTHNAYTLKGQLLNTGHALTNAIMEK